MTPALLLTTLLLSAEVEPALTPRKTELSVTSGASTNLPLSIAFAGGLRVEHGVSEKLSVSMAFNARVDRSSTDAPPGALTFSSSSNSLTLSLVPTVRRWFGERPLSGIFVGLSVPFSYSRGLDASLLSGWSLGVVGDVGYSLQLVEGFIAQLSVGPGYTVGTSKLAGVTTTRSQLGLFSTFSVGYAF